MRQCSKTSRLIVIKLVKLEPEIFLKPVCIFLAVVSNGNEIKKDLL